MKDALAYKSIHLCQQFQEMTKVETNSTRALISYKRKFNERQLNVANSFGVQAYNASEKAHRIP